MRDIINASISLNNIVCHDEGDGWGSAEPYLWTVFFKIDGSTVSLNDSLKLTGSATIHTTPGSHGNLGDTDVDEGDTVAIPTIIGQWDTKLTPIPVPQWVKNLGTDDIAAVTGVICILMEEDNVSDSGANAGHNALNNAVQVALDKVVNSLGFTHQEISDEDINKLTDSISSQISSAIKDSQNAFQNLWSWLNPDDMIGSKVFRFDQDTLISNGNTTLNHRWKNEGDWEINGNISASVACSSNQIKMVSEILKGLFSKESEKAMKSFRKTDYPDFKNLHEWWILTERNSGHLTEAILKNPDLLTQVLSIQNNIAKLLSNRNEIIESNFWESSKIILKSIYEVNPRNRSIRKDISRSLDMIKILEGKNMNQVFETLNSIQPARHPNVRIAGNSVRICKNEIKISSSGIRESDERTFE